MITSSMVHIKSTVVNSQKFVQEWNPHNDLLSFFVFFLSQHVCCSEILNNSHQFFILIILHMVTWYGDSEDDVDDHQDPLYD